MPELTSLQILMESQRRMQDLYSRFITPMLSAELQKRSPYYQALTEAAKQRGVATERGIELEEEESQRKWEEMQRQKDLVQKILGDLPSTERVEALRPMFPLIETRQEAIRLFPDILAPEEEEKPIEEYTKKPYWTDPEFIATPRGLIIFKNMIGELSLTDQLIKIDEALYDVYDKEVEKELIRERDKILVKMKGEPIRLPEKKIKGIWEKYITP